MQSSPSCQSQGRRRLLLRPSGCTGGQSTRPNHRCQCANHSGGPKRHRSGSASHCYCSQFPGWCSCRRHWHRSRWDNRLAPCRPQHGRLGVADTGCVKADIKLNSFRCLPQALGSLGQTEILTGCVPMLVVFNLESLFHQVICLDRNCDLRALSKSFLIQNLT